MAKTVPCPKCVRLNAAHRQTCLYCGEPMPAPEPKAPPKRREVPANLDVLIRRAFQGGTTRHLESALSEGAEALEPRHLTPIRPGRVAADQLKPGAGEVIVPSSAQAPQPEAPTQPAAFSVPAELQEDEPPTDEVPAPRGEALEPVDPHAALLALWDQADRALQRYLEGDLQSAHEALDTLEAAAAAARAALPDRETWAVQLPNYTRPYALVIEGLGGPERAPALAEALEMDPATARLNAVSHWSRTALRGDDREALERLAIRARSVDIAAAVLDREALLLAPAALWVIGRIQDEGRPSTRWVVCARPPERLDPDAALEAGTLEVEAGGFRLAVPGDVVIRRFRERTSTRWTRGDGGVQELGERRASVLDLYGDGPPLRLVVGLTSFEGLPGYVSTSGARSLKNLVEQLQDAWPGIRVEGRRVCAPFKTGRIADGEDTAQVSGWPLWEEHSRSCWLLHKERPGP